MAKKQIRHRHSITTPPGDDGVQLALFFIRKKMLQAPVGTEESAIKREVIRATGIRRETERQMVRSLAARLTKSISACVALCRTLTASAAASASTSSHCSLR